MSEPLSEQAIQDALSALPGWSYADDKITKTYQFHHFKEAFGFLTRVAFEAEASEHHPEIFNVYKTVTLSLNTHDAGSKVTQKDLDLASAIEQFCWV